MSRPKVDHPRHSFTFRLSNPELDQVKKAAQLDREPLRPWVRKALLMVAELRLEKEEERIHDPRAERGA